MNQKTKTKYKISKSFQPIPSTNIATQNPSKLKSTLIPIYTMTRSWGIPGFGSSAKPSPSCNDDASKTSDAPAFVVPTSSNTINSRASQEPEIPIMFPAPDSQQRAGSSRSLAKPNQSSLAPNTRNGLNAPLSGSSGPGLVPSSAAAAARARSKVALKPGHSPLDWANLSNSGKNLRVRISL